MFCISPEIERQKKIITYVIFLYICLFFIISAIFQLFGLSLDYFGYQDIFTYERRTIRKTTEPVFLFLRFLNDIFFGSKMLPIFIFTTLFSFLVKWKAFRKITGKNDPYILFVCHTICFFWIQEYTQIRVSCAIAIFLCSIQDLVNNNNKKYLVKAFIATLFHYSAFTMFVFFLYVKLFRRKYFYILFPIMGFIFANVCSSIIGNKIQGYIHFVEQLIGLNKSGNISNFMSPFNAKYLLLLSTFIINGISTPQGDYINSNLMKAMSFGLCFYYWLNPAGLPVISVRLAEFYTSVFVLYFFLNIKNLRIKEKIFYYIWVLIVVILYFVASLRTAIL